MVFQGFFIKGMSGRDARMIRGLKQLSQKKLNENLTVTAYLKRQMPLQYTLNHQMLYL